MEVNQEKRLTNKEVFGYSFYSIASLFGMISFAFLNMFYPALGMDMNLFSTALLIARIFDFVITLFVGGIMSKVHPKIGGGKYRPWLFICQFVIYAGMVLLFTDFGSNTSRFIVVIIGSLMVNTTMSFIVTAQFGIIPQMAGASAIDRNRLTTWNYRMMTFGTVFTSASGAYILAWIGTMVSPPLNYTIMTAVFALFYFVGIAVLRKTAKPYDISDEVGGMGAPQVRLSDMVKAVTTNSQLLIYLLASTFAFTGMMAMMNVMIYYWQLIVPYTHNIPMSSSFPGLYTIGSTLTTVASSIFALIGPAIGMKLGKVKAMWVGLMLAACSGVLNAFFGSTFWGLYVGISFIGTFAAALYSGFGVNYALDCGEYGLWKTGKDNRLVIMSMTNMPMKISAIFGGFVLYALSGIGYDSLQVAAATTPIPGQEALFGQIPAFVSAPGFVRNFMLLLGGIPAACNMIAALLMLFAYKISDKDATRYAQENMAKMAPPPQA
ncbi:MAG: MFS transporter [Eubacteriaceae bacterium]|jgi:Na+/melibiose symporter-like transporter|nr:MFS transporter [Eubacteriaceae bacterium]